MGSNQVLLGGMISPASAMAMSWSIETGNMEKAAAPLVGGKTDLAGDAITHTASWTLFCHVRAAGENLQASTAEICELRNHATTSDNSTVLVRISVGATGGILIDLPRFGGSSNQTDIASQIDIVLISIVGDQRR